MNDEAKPSYLLIMTSIENFRILRAHGMSITITKFHFFWETLSHLASSTFSEVQKKTQKRQYLGNRWSYEFLKPLFDPKGSKIRFYVYMGHTIWNVEFCFEQCRELSNVENWAMSRIEKFPVSRVEYFITENQYSKK